MSAKTNVVLACLLLIGSASLAGEGATMGWRGDGSGRYPNANPPLEWGRVAKSIKELSAQATKPKDDALPAKESAIPDGILRDWLVLGPIQLTDESKPDEPIAGAEAQSPDKDEKACDLKWQATKLDNSCLDLCALLHVSTTQKGVAAYAHTYIYSPSDRSVAYNTIFQGQGICRIWLNGTQIYNSGKNTEIGAGPRLGLALKKGWNRLLVLNAKTVANRKSWWITGSLHGNGNTEYETHGVVWETTLPTGGSCPPVIMGDRLVFTSESGSVVCVNKADGKILWIRTLTFYDFATEQERKENPEVFKELDPLAAKVKEYDQSDTAVPWKAPVLEKDLRSNLEPPLFFKGMSKVSKDKYNNPATWGCEAGNTPCTPVTDGKNVYALFNTGIVACFDAEGTCKWKRLLKHTMVEHGYASSPLLVDGKLVVHHDYFTILDPKTGEIVFERPHLVDERTQRPRQFYGTGCVLLAGDEKVVHYPNGEFVRLRDGKTLSMDPKVYTPQVCGAVWGSFLSSPVVEGGVAYNTVSNNGGVAAFKLPPLQGDTVAPEIVHKIPFTTDQFPYYYEPFHCASPLLHEGLLYCLNDFGLLTVVDLAKNEVAYQKLLDLNVFMPYSTPVILKGGASASPTLAGKYIYLWGNQGTCIVIEPGRAYKQVARNRIEKFLPAWPAHQEATTVEPIFEGDRMYYRAEGTLYCIGPR